MNAEEKKAHRTEYRKKNEKHIMAYNAEYRKKNKEHIAIQQAEYYEKNKENLLVRAAVNRGRNKQRRAAWFVAYREKNRERLAAQRATYREKNRKHLAVCETEYRQNLRVRFYDMYGLKKDGHEHRVCTCCKEADLMLFGTVSHIDGSGKQHRELAGSASPRMLKDALSVYDPTRFAAECWNCNMGAVKNGGICPHKAGSLKSPDYHVVVRGGVRPEKGGQ